MSDAVARTNPYDFVSDIKDKNLFAGRRSELAAIADEIAGLAGTRPISPIFALVGERRVGKTSLLHRISEICTEHEILSCQISVTSQMAADAGDFWFEVLQRLLTAANRAGVISLSQPGSADVGFRQGGAPGKVTLPTPDIAFFTWYTARSVQPSIPPTSLVGLDFNALCEVLLSAHYKGLLLMFDEAHFLTDSLDITQQLRYVLREASRCGVVFAGERSLNQMFTAQAAPFYLQARIMPVQNFVSKQDVAECALLPLTDSEQLLMSPITVDHLYRLSHGKPNQIRLICHSIYKRYQKDEQKDLNLTIETLDDVLDVIQASYTSEYDLRDRVDMIRRLPSVELEALYLITRFPEWQARDVVALDEAFRGEEHSDRAAARRASRLEMKRKAFVELGLLRDETDRYALAGDEFLQLYLRFWYEVQKYGALRKRIHFDEGPPTPFGEKADKLIRSLAWAVGRMPAVVMCRFSSSEAHETDSIARVRRRCEFLQTVKSAGRVRSADEALLFVESFELCNVVAQASPYYLLVVSIRNLENPRESVVLEIYFDGAGILTFPRSLITRQAQAARILVDEFDSWTVELPSLEELVKSMSGRTLDEIFEKGNAIGKWRVLSVKKMVEDARMGKSSDNESKPDEERKPVEWADLYEKGRVNEAVAAVTEELARSPLRPVAARLYNNRGYMRYSVKDKSDDAKRDLERALDLHFQHLALTLLNLSVVAIDRGAFPEAIESIEDALLLTLGQESIEASFLRLRVLGSNLMFARREEWEQHPANVLEAGYVNLGYAVAREHGPDASKGILEEGLELVPSSIYLRHALARLYLSQHRADLADRLYGELAGMAVPDGLLANEVKMYRRLGAPRRHKR